MIFFHRSTGSGTDTAVSPTTSNGSDRTGRKDHTTSNRTSETEITPVAGKNPNRSQIPDISKKGGQKLGRVRISFFEISDRSYALQLCYCDGLLFQIYTTTLLNPSYTGGAGERGWLPKGFPLITCDWDKLYKKAKFWLIQLDKN